MSPPLAGRIRAVDWLRGVATLAMIETHALALLKPGLRAGRWFVHLDGLNGLVAPAFIFAAGFSLALVQARGAASGARGKRVLRTLRRILEVLLVGTLVNWAWFPIFREPHWILRIDILQCIGLALLLALPILALLAPHPRALGWAALALAAACFGAAPLAEGIRGPLAHFANVSSGSVFPLLPWSGYVYLGASAGAVAAGGRRGALVGWLLFLSAAGLACHLARPLFLAAYPPHTFWLTDPSGHADRWALVSLAAAALVWIEGRLGANFRPGPALAFVTVFGQSSLAAYFFHELLLYRGLFGLCLAAFWADRSGWALYLALTALLVGLTYGLCRLTDAGYRIYDRALFGWLKS